MRGFAQQCLWRRDAHRVQAVGSLTDLDEEEEGTFITCCAKGISTLGITSRGGALRLFVLEQLRKTDIEHVVRKNLGEVEAIYSDMCGKLHFLKNIAPHETVNHWLSYVNGEAHVNNCENAFSLFKRGLSGLFHHVSAKWLQSYLDAFAFRYSHRYEKGRLFDLVLASC